MKGQLTVVSSPLSVAEGVLIPSNSEADYGQRTSADRQVFMQAFPKKIRLKGENNSLAVDWSDGHHSAYPYRLLRDRCPCATCADSSGPQPVGESPFPILGVKPLKPDRAELVGRYALQIHWNDGHSSGIYSFDYLRGLCPCPECEVSRQSTASKD